MGKIVILLIAILVAFISFFARYYLRRDFFHGMELSRADFNYPANITMKSIPTTLYCTSAELEALLPKWDDRPIHLYRSKPNCGRDVELNKLKTTVRARRSMKECHNKTTICAHSSCIPPKNDVHMVGIQEVLSDPGWYVNFDAFWSEEALAVLNRVLPISLLNRNFPVMHGFISNFKESVITAIMHANPLSSSLAVQYAGSKTWLFFSREIYLSEDGFFATPNAVFSIPRKAPARPFDVYGYTSQPGDLLFFQESWAHTVLSHAGPNILVNYRSFQIGNILRQPLNFLHSLLSRTLHNDRELNAENKVKPSRVQEEHMAKQNRILCEDGITHLDQVLLDLVLATADAAKQ